MARPRDIRFYDRIDPNDQKNRPWLLEYCTNSRKLCEYMEQKGAGSTARFYTINLLTILYEYLLESDIMYSDSVAEKWFSERQPHIKGEKITLDRLIDIYKFGEVQPIHAYPFVLPYTDALCPMWKDLLTEYLDTVDHAERTKEQIRNCIARYLYRLQSWGITVPEKITFDVIESYCQIDAHASDNSKVRYTYAIGDIMNYMADKGLCIHGLAWYPYFRMHNRIFDIKDFADDQISEIEGAREIISLLSAEGFARLIPVFLNDFTAAGYSDSPCKTASYVLHNLLLFMEINGLNYSKAVADVWLEHETTYHHNGNSWKQAWRVIYLFDVFVKEKNLAINTIQHCKSLKCEMLPPWCKTELDSYLKIKKKEGWSVSTINMIRSSVTRFCEYLVCSGLTSFFEVSPEVIKDFNLNDRHETPEGKNAYNVRIRRFIRYLERKEILPFGINEALYCASEKREHIVKTLSSEEKDVINSKNSSANTPMELRDTAILLLGIKMGLRSIDITSLKLSDIDWDGQTVRIVQEKTDHEIILPMPVSVGNAIYRYITEGRANERTVSPYLFIKNRVPYDKVGRSVCRGALKRTLPARPDDRSGFHITRKTFATDNLMKGASKQVLADLLGHRTTNTLAPYLLLDEDRMRMCPLSLSETGLLMKGGRYDIV
ncbi:tyrosine-type recombinase/integrase [Pseudobutyrivibrio xylanivorans]|uniref:Tyrosine-type recombinase/integrase n=1 Tax=Pseudobutyrivibrio xylanivorans TaxID=185007 RepID=A0A5P6VSV0_PSEXY|nr:tyrosine-type recombinase/integrase [Pseudobutyrivibrio xylanivorans]QFJ53921.1 tyrosine-type recombinase/integrase [Pseudobutyrivibrio xylanivorans]